MVELPGFAAVIINEHNPNLFLSGKWFGFAFCSGTFVNAISSITLDTIIRVGYNSITKTNQAK